MKRADEIGENEFISSRRSSLTNEGIGDLNQASKNLEISSKIMPSPISKVFRSTLLCLVLVPYAKLNLSLIAIPPK